MAIPTLAKMLACDEIMKTGASHEDALTAAECALEAAAPLTAVTG